MRSFGIVVALALEFALHQLARDGEVVDPARFLINQLGRVAEDRSADGAALREEISQMIFDSMVAEQIHELLLRSGQTPISIRLHPRLSVE